MTSPESGDFDAAPVRSVTRPERWRRAGGPGGRANTAAEAATVRWRGLGGLRPRRGTVGCGIWSQTGRPWCPPPRVCSLRSRTREYVRASVSLFFYRCSVRPSVRAVRSPHTASDRPSARVRRPAVRCISASVRLLTTPVTVLNFCPTPPSFSPCTSTGAFGDDRSTVRGKRKIILVFYRVWLLPFSSAAAAAAK